MNRKVICTPIENLLMSIYGMGTLWQACFLTSFPPLKMKKKKWTIGLDERKILGYLLLHCENGEGEMSNIRDDTEPIEKTIFLMRKALSRLVKDGRIMKVRLLIGTLHVVDPWKYIIEFIILR